MKNNTFKNVMSMDFKLYVVVKRNWNLFQGEEIEFMIIFMV